MSGSFSNDEDDGVLDVDKQVAPVAVFRGTKIHRTTEVVPLSKMPSTVAKSAVEAMSMLAQVDTADSLGETPKGYCVLVEHNSTTMAIMLSKAQEKAFVRRAYAKSGATGNVPWQALASGKTVKYLGSTMTLSSALSQCILEKKGVSVSLKSEPTVVIPQAPEKSTAVSTKKKKKRERTPSISSSDDSDEEASTTTEEDEEDGSDNDESVALSDYEDEDNADLIEEDGGCAYAMTVKLKGGTPRAVKLGLKRFAASFNS